MTDAKLVSIAAQIFACNARIAAMQAENMHKNMCGDSQLYLEENFWREAEKLEALAAEALEIRKPTSRQLTQAEQAAYERVALMDKDELEAFAQTHFNVRLNRRQRVESMRQQVQGLIGRYGLKTGEGNEI